MGVALDDFAAEVGTSDPVTVVGGGTQWDVGGPPAAGVREVRAPAGVAWVRPDEMTACCGAGTSVADLDAALGEHGQWVALPAWNGATVGGVLAVGHSGLRRLGYGPARDTVLQVRYVSAEGKVITAGGPTVKNVSGYDLCRLLVGSLGTLGLLGEVLVRTRPRPAVSQWLAGSADPFALRRKLHAPVSLLWDGTTTWVLLEGNAGDVEAQAALSGLDPVDGPPALPPHRWSVPPEAFSALRGTFVAEVGVGVVHHADPQPRRVIEPGIVELNRRLKLEFDPTSRLNPGRDPLAT